MPRRYEKRPAQISHFELQISSADFYSRHSAHRSLFTDYCSLLSFQPCHSFFSSFFTSAFTFSQKDSFGAFLQASAITGTIFSIPATLTPALSGLPLWLRATAQ